MQRAGRQPETQPMKRRWLVAQWRIQQNFTELENVGELPTRHHLAVWQRFNADNIGAYFRFQAA